MKTGYRLECPECNSPEIEEHFSPKGKNVKFKCKKCHKVRMLSKMTYTSIIIDD